LFPTSMPAIRIRRESAEPVAHARNILGLGKTSASFRICGRID
jgi:hypothetical protein